MPIIRTNNHIQEYSARAQYFDRASMSGRGADRDTLAVAQNIAEYIGTLPEGTVLDVGCGDGTLLHLLSGKRVGISPSQEEVVRLRALWVDVGFEVGLAQAIPLPDASVSVLVCNSVILALETETEVRRALTEFARVCQPGAVIFLGEIPAQPVRSEYRHDSVPVWLWSLLTRGGPKNFLAGILDVAQAAFTDRPLLFYPERWFHCPRDPFIAMVAEYGFVLLRDRVTPHNSDRRDYVFVKRS